MVQWNQKGRQTEKNSKSEMSKHYGYVRVSTTKQGDGVSLEEQRESIQRYARKHDLEIIRWFEEKETAAKQGRPEFTRMLGLLRDGQAEGVVIHKIDRSSRNLKDWAELGDLIDEGIEIHFANEGFDLSSRGGRLSADIQAVVAADYIRNLRQEVKKGFYGRLKQGLYPLPAPVGYTDEGGGKPKDVDPVQGPLVQKAFELYATGEYSVESLAEEMRHRGLKNSTGGTATRNSVWRMLKNPFYMGLIRIKKTGETFDGVHEPLVTKSVFDKVQNILSGRAPKQTRTHDFLFRRLFQCKHCGRSLIAEEQKGHIYYRCHTSDCPTKCLREDRLEEQVLAAFEPLQLNSQEKAHLDQQLDNLRNRWDENRQNDIQAIELQLEKLSSRLDRLTDAFLDQTIEKDLFEKKKSSLLNQRTELEERLRNLRANDVSVPDQVDEILELAKTACTCYKLGTKDEKRDLLQTLTSNRAVNRRNVSIELKKPFRMIAERPPISDGGLCRETTRTSGGVLAVLDRILTRRATD